MAKIIASKDLDKEAVFFTLNQPQKGCKLFFLDSALTDGLLSVYDSEEEGKQKYANGIRCLICDDIGLRPYVMPLLNLTAISAEAVEDTFTPQMQHEITRKINALRVDALLQLAKDKAVCKLGETYAVKVRRRSDDSTFNWTTYGLDATKEKYTIKNGTVSYGEQSISVEECKTFFAERDEKQTERLQNR